MTFGRFMVHLWTVVFSFLILMFIISWDIQYLWRACASVVLIYIFEAVHQSSKSRS